jgi:hypothetical protein
MFVEEERVIGKNAEFQTGQIGWTRWAIRRDQLKLLEVLSPTAIGIVTYVTVAAASPYVLAAALLFSIITLALRLKTKAVVLERDQYRLLMALKHTRSADPKQLSEILNWFNEPDSQLFTESRVLELLKGLKEVRAKDGTIENLLVETSDGRWSANGV